MKKFFVDFFRAVRVGFFAYCAERERITEERKIHPPRHCGDKCCGCSTGDC